MALTGYEGLASPQFSPPPGRYTQRPDEILDYEIDLSGWLAPGDTITAATVTADAGLIITDVSFTTTTLTFWVSGGVASYGYRVKALIQTSGGRTVDRRLWWRIKSA